MLSLPKHLYRFVWPYNEAVECFGKLSMTLYLTRY